jgi:hypothetical protein
MKRVGVGTVGYHDSALDTRAEIVVSAFPDMREVSLFLDLDAAGRGVRGGGHCEFGMGLREAKSFMQALDKAARGAPEVQREETTRFRYAWCDNEQFEDHEGSVAVLTNQGRVSIIVHLDPRNRLGDYVATLQFDDLRRLMELLRKSLELLGEP